MSKRPQQLYYEEEWSHLKLADTLGKTGWRTMVPAPDFFNFISYLEENNMTGKVLDLGCGGGRHAIVFAQKGFEAFGIDFAASAIKVAKANAEHAGLKDRIDFMVGDVLQLPYPDEQFDVINDDGCLHHINPDDWNLYVENVSRVLKSEGFLRIKVFSKNCQYFREHNTQNASSQWVQLADSGGTHFFEESEIRQLFGGKFKIIGLEEKEHPKTDAKKFYFAVFQKT